MSTQFFHKVIIFLLLILMLLFSDFICITNQRTVKASPQTLRVGYIDYANFIETEIDGSYSGYGVDYLNEISKKTGWKYDYVLDRWPNLLARLQSGDIDLIASAQYSEDRAATFDFSNTPIGKESTLLYTAANRSDIYYDDYPAMAGKRVGLLSDSYQNSTFFDYAAAHGFGFIPVYYPSDAEMMEALNDGAVDLLVTGSLSFHQELKLVGQFGSDPFYFMTQKNNQAILDPLNAAMATIQSEKPYFESNLYKKYYKALSNSTTPSFTREEAEYIQTAPVLKIGVIPNYAPMSQYANGLFSGINIDFANAIQKKSGLFFEYLPLAIGERPIEALDSKKCDLIVGANRTEKYLQNPAYILTDSYLNINSVSVGRTGETVDCNDDLTAAILRSYQSLEIYLATHRPNYKILYCDNPGDAMDAVKSGKADITLMNNYMADYILQNPHYDGLSVNTALSYNEEPAIISRNDADATLISVLNKSINSFSTAESEEIIIANTIAHSYDYSFTDTLYKYRSAWFFILFSIALAAFFFYLFKQRTQQTRLLQEESENLRHRAECDALTGLYNKETFYAKTAELIHQHPDQLFCIITLDIERFKIINDLYGIAAGDVLLQKLGRFIEGNAPGQPFITSRLDSDNFAICCLWEEKKLPDFRQHLRDFLKHYPLNFNITSRCGLYFIQDRDTPVHLMCDRANMAAEKVRGSELSHLAFYDDAQRDSLLQEQWILNEMEHALASGQFCVYFQPKYQAKSGQITGSEALVRWIHPEKGIISPGAFVPSFEKSGFIVKLDRFVWTETCRKLQEWQQTGKALYPVSVNMSRMNLYNDDICQVFKDLTTSFNISPELLQIEVTETAYMENPQSLIRTMRQLKNSGFTILMDDFGSGYSSLNILKDLPVDVLKIDMRFIRDLEDNPRSEPILKSIVQMTKNLGLLVIVEGVETKAQLDFLIAIDADEIQGFYFSRPLPVKEFEALLC